MYYSDDPVRDYDRYCAEQERAIARLPICVDCDEPIQDEDAYYINGEWICLDCMDSYRREVLPE